MHYDDVCLRYVGNLNPKRASKRVCHEETERIPIPVSKPFKPNGFHFLKVKEAEVMYVFRENELRPFNSFDEISESDHLVIINVNPVGAGHSLLGKHIGSDLALGKRLTSIKSRI